MSILKTLSDIEEVILKCKGEAIEIIEKAKSQNPKINPIGSGRCFTVKFSDLSEDLVLSPKYYDFLWQYDALIEKLHKQSLSAFKNTMQTLIETGKLDSQRFHPDVIDKIKNLM